MYIEYECQNEICKFEFCNQEYFTGPDLDTMLECPHCGRKNRVEVKITLQGIPLKED